MLRLLPIFTIALCALLTASMLQRTIGHDDTALRVLALVLDLAGIILSGVVAVLSIRYARRNVAK